MTKTKITIKSPKGIELLKNAMRDLGIKAGQKVEKIAVINAPSVQGHYRGGIKFDGRDTITAHIVYSAAIEYGFDNYEENVKEHERVIKQAFGKAITPKVVTVKAHTRTMNRKPNPVMRNAAAQTQKEIPQIWKEALRDNGL